MTATTTEGYVGIAGRDEFFDAPNDVPVYINGMDNHDVIYGYHKADTLIGGLGKDLILGLNGNDAIYGDQFWNDETWTGNFALSAGADILFGGNGADTIFGGGANNYVNGGLGEDYIMGGSGWELLQGGEGNDTIFGDTGDDTLVGGTRSVAESTIFLNANFSAFTTEFNGVTDAAENRFMAPSDYASVDLALTNTGSDYLDGGVGNDTLIGGDGVDTMIGGLGNDKFYVDHQFDVVVEVAGQGYDVVYSSAFAYTLADHTEVLSLSGGGTKGVGNAQTNTILGNSGDNLLDGGAGADDLSGLGGDDIFALRAGEAHGDVIYEFNGNGAGSGDVLLFVGYGTQQQGASLQQIDANHWQVTSWDGSMVETITMMPGSGLDTTHDVLFV